MLSLLVPELAYPTSTGLMGPPVTWSPPTALRSDLGKVGDQTGAPSGPRGSQPAVPGLLARLTFRSALGAGSPRALVGGRGSQVRGPGAGGRAGWWRWAEPGGKSTHGCGWLPPVAQYQAEAGEDRHFSPSKHPPIASITIDCEKAGGASPRRSPTCAPPRLGSGTPGRGPPPPAAPQGWASTSAPARLAASGTAATS